MTLSLGKLTVTEAAKQMGISRKTYYQWEKRALQGMADRLEQGDPGRPEVPVDPEKEAMKKRLEEMEKELTLAKQTAEVRDMLKLLHSKDRKSDGKKNRKRKKRSSKRS